MVLGALREGDEKRDERVSRDIQTSVTTLTAVTFASRPIDRKSAIIAEIRTCDKSCTRYPALLHNRGISGR